MSQSLFRLPKSVSTVTSYRSRLFEGILYDVRKRFVGSALGTFWIFLLPTLQLSIYALIYALIFRVRVPDLSTAGYILLVFSGLVPLMAFNESLISASLSLSANKNLLLNTVFPAELLPLRAAVSASATGLVGLSLTLVVSLFMGHAAPVTFIFVPFFWMLLLMMSVGMGWILSLISLVAQDVQQILTLIIMLLFVLSPFAYTPEMVPSSLKLILYLNPLSYFVLSFQQLITYGTLPTPLIFIGCVFLACLFYFVGFSFFQKAKFIFFDYV